MSENQQFENRNNNNRRNQQLQPENKQPNQQVNQPPNQQITSAENSFQSENYFSNDNINKRSPDDEFTIVSFIKDNLLTIGLLCLMFVLVGVLINSLMATHESFEILDNSIEESKKLILDDIKKIKLKLQIQDVDENISADDFKKDDSNKKKVKKPQNPKSE